MEILRRRTVGRRTQWRWLAATAGGALAVLAVWAEVPREYDVKSVLLFNLTQFIDWPPAAFAGPEAPFVIGIYGRDPFGPGLDEIVRDERAAGRRIVVERVRDAAAAAHCQLLFVSASERTELPVLLPQLARRPLLTVAEFDGFLRRGGMVRFYKNSDNKIRLRVNLEAARRAQLAMSAKLLRVAEILPEDER